MDPILYLAIALIVLLVAVFIVSYVLNKRTPVPKGCENLKISEEFCMQCPNKDCQIREKYVLEQAKKEIDAEKEES